MGKSVPVRIPERVHAESKQFASIRGQQVGDVLELAWDEFLARHREEFAADLEATARIVREGTTADLAKFLNRNVESVADQRAERLRSRVPTN